MENEQKNILDLKPPDMPDYLILAWISFISFCLRHNDCLEAYQKETGDTFKFASTPIDRAIDEVTGREWGFLSNFVSWVNKNHWGEFKKENKNV